jgi:hypothetical protein
MSERRYESFEEFWPFYVKEHQKKATRILHFIGTTAAASCIVGAIVTKRKWLLAVAPVAGYGPAWISHFFIEKNRPATFKYPVWSLKADMIMWWKTATFSMDAEVERVLAEDQARRDAEAKAEEQPVATTQGEAVN